MLERALVHIGAHKTGSTAIQESLLEHKVRIEEEHGLHIPTEEHGILNHSFLASWAFGREWESVEMWLAQAAAHSRAHGLRGTLITGEDLSSLTPKKVRRLIALLKRHYTRIDVSLYLRNKSDYLVSQYLHWLTHNAQVGLTEFTSKMKFSPRFCVEAWQCASDTPLEWTRVEDLVSVEQHFFSTWFGWDVQPRRSNVSLDAFSSLLVNLFAKRVECDLDSFTYEIRGAGVGASDIGVDRVRASLARELSRVYSNEDWVVPLPNGGELALIDDRHYDPAPFGIDELERYAEAAKIFFAKLAEHQRQWQRISGRAEP